MTHNDTPDAPFRWTAQREEAAILIAHDRLTHKQIAEQVGVEERKTLYRWQQHPEFSQRVAEIRAEYRKAVLERGIANVTVRIAALNERHQLLQRIIAERADAYEMQDVPGGSTGLLTRELRSMGTGQHQTVIEEYKVDTGLLNELRQHEKQVAQELGQWTEKRELTGKDGAPLPASPTVLVYLPDNGRADEPGDS